MMQSILPPAMQALNTELFQVLGAGFSPTPALLALAQLLAQAGVWVVMGLLLGAVIRKPARAAECIAALLLAGCATLLAHQLAKWIGSPRPFMVELSPVYVAHAARAGFPSTHASALGALCCFLLLTARWRPVSFLVVVASLAIGWSRIYLGLHFPLDILGGFVLGAVIGAIGALCWAAAIRVRAAHSAQRKPQPA